MSLIFRTHNSIPDTIAEVDLGSNSFHLIVARVENGQIPVVDRLRERVRLDTGLGALVSRPTRA